MSVIFFMYMPLSMFRKVIALRMSNFIICEWQASLLHSIQNDCLFIIIMILVFNLKFFLVSDSVYYSVQAAAFMFT